jgi:signal transduction histidine kinase/ligand-binding sensor domain-containing protein
LHRYHPEEHHSAVLLFTGKRVRWRILLLLMAVAAAACHAADGEQPWQVRVWKVSEGLGGTYVSGVAETADGFLWVVAGGELARFDGSTFLRFPVDGFAGKPARRIREFTRTRDGGLAFGLYDGHLVRVLAGVATILPVVVPHDQVRLEALTEDDDGNFLIVYNDESVWRVRRDTVTRLTDDDGLPPGAHCRFTRDRQGRIWFAKGDYIGIMRGDRFETLQRFPELSFVRVGAAHDGGVWIGAGARLLHFNIGSPLTEIATIPLTDVAVRPTFILEDREGAIWFGTYGSGLFRFDGARFESVPISHRQAVNMTEDREGNIWVATSGGGLDQVQPRAIAIEGADTGVPYQAVQAVVEDRDHRLWGFTQNGIVVTRRSSAWERVDEIKSEGEVSCICLGPDNALWIGTKTGSLHRWRDGQLATWKHADGVATSRFQSVFAAHNGDLWLGGARPASLQRFRQDKFQTFDLPRPAESIRVITEDAHGDIWVAATGRQLVRISADGRMTDQSACFAAVERNIHIIVPRPDGSLWLCLDRAGIGRWKDGVLTRLSTNEGLLTNHIEAMLPDALGNWWFAGSEMIFKIAEPALLDVFEGRAKRVQPIRYGGEQGLRPVFGETVVPLRRSNGKLWIPMATSLAIIDPAQVRPLSEPPPVWITEVRIDDHPLAVHRGVLPVGALANTEGTLLHLRPEHRRIDIEFTAPSFHTPSNVAFRFRLDPFDDNWSEAGPRRHVSYSRLPAGDYRFRVIACNGDGVWNETGAVATFVVDPYFWETWWFRGVVVAAFAAAVFALARYVSYRRLRLRLQAAERETAVERERARIARDIHDDLGSRLTRIMMLGGLVKRDRAAPQKMEARIDEISDTAHQVLKSLDETVWAVDPRNDNLPEIISYLAQFAENYFRTAEIACELELPPDPSPTHVSTPVFRHELFLAVKEALTNVVRHAQATQVTFRIRVSANALEIEIIDNGRGFSGAGSDAHADGLRNMRRRMEQIGGRFEVESTPGAGTRLVLIAPWPPRA